VAEECALVTADSKVYATIGASHLADYVEWVEDEI